MGKALALMVLGVSLAAGVSASFATERESHAGNGVHSDALTAADTQSTNLNFTGNGTEKIEHGRAELR